MARIKDAIKDVLGRLSGIKVINQDGSEADMYARIYNGQIDAEGSGKLGYNYPKPATFLEVMNDQMYDSIGLGFQAADLVFRIHLVHEYYNEDGTFEQDLEIYDLRDKVVSLLSFFKPAGCGVLERRAEQQDYAHNNIYHYVIDFACNFIDSTASKYDSDHPDAYIYSNPPTDLEINVDIEKVDYGVRKNFIIPK